MPTRLFLITLILVMGKPAFAQIVPGFQSGNTLLAECRDPAQRQACTGYVIAVVDTLLWDKGDPSKFVCIPQGVTRGQVRDVVVRYLEQHPEERHNIASALVGLALMQAFPCGK